MLYSSETSVCSIYSFVHVSGSNSDKKKKELQGLDTTYDAMKKNNTALLLTTNQQPLKTYKRISEVDKSAALSELGFLFSIWSWTGRFNNQENRGINASF